jgi:NAD(P)H-dependent FMN reductase
VLDLRDHPLPFFDGIPPARAPREYAHDAVAAVGRQIDAADAFVIVTGEYNHGYPAVLKNLLDWTFPEWQRKPVGFVGWGNVGGARAIEQLREVVIEMEMAPIRFAVHVLRSARPRTPSGRGRACLRRPGPEDGPPRRRPHLVGRHAQGRPRIPVIMKVCTRKCVHRSS